jgi:anthranilate synthase component II
MAKQLLIIDNYDSFTFNLVQLVREQSNFSVLVIKNNELQINDIKQFDKIIFSQGAGVPSDIAVMQQIMEEYKSNKSILGVCLGHQSIAAYFGFKLKNMEDVFHGEKKSSNY